MAGSEPSFYKNLGHDPDDDDCDPDPDSHLTMGRITQPLRLALQAVRKLGVFLEQRHLILSSLTRKPL